MDEPSPGQEPSEKPPPPAPVHRFEATIRRTSHGVPHIIGKDLGSVAFGQGYAFAQDHVCVLADQIVKIRSERASYLGAGSGNSYVGTDFAYLALDLYHRARTALPQLPADVRETIQGYAAGYNQYLEETGPAGLPAACANAAWVKPINDVDLMAYHINLALLSSSYQFLLPIASAQPPATLGGLRIDVPSQDAFKAWREHDLGSNGWALGAERSRSGLGLLLANPHFPWQGEFRLWESQLTVPGVMNVYGASLLGVPGVLIGFNDHLAWTHTVSAGQRGTFYRLKLVSGKPTHYLYDGQEREMTSRAYTVNVLQPDGSLKSETRTLYSSHLGPIVTINGVTNWTPQYAYAYRDANLDNTVMLAQFLSMDRARSLQEFQQHFATFQGIPWVNTMATDRDGNTWYADAAATPNLSETAIQSWLQASSGAEPVATQFLRQLNLVLLDGSTSANEWVDAPNARGPGLVPFARVPQLQRRDFVANANDSYWLANPAAPLPEFSPLHGFARRSQSPRTRINLRMLTEVAPDGASGADGRFTLDELQAALFSNRSLTAELLRTQLVERCQRTPSATYNNQTVDLTRACELLAAWNGRFDADSVGAVLWREFTGAYPVSQLLNKGTLFSTAFDPNLPIDTPSSLVPAPATGEDMALVKLAQAVTVLGSANLPLDTPLSTAQYTPRAGRRIGLHGGLNVDGVANIVSYDIIQSTVVDRPPVRSRILNPTTGLTTEGYVVAGGSSFIMALEFTPEGVNARALLTYGETSNPLSPLFVDQTELFARKQWRPVRFTEAEILMDPNLVQVSLSRD